MEPDRETPQPDATAPHEQPAMLRITLSSIGDAVITTDTSGRVTFLNPVAQSLTGWTQADAAGIHLEQIFKIVNEETRRPVENPASRALREGKVVGLANHTLLITKDGTEKSIGYTAAPIHDANGEVVGIALVFRDFTERRLQEQLLQDTVNYAEAILATLREPFIVLDDNLRIKRRIEVSTRPSKFSRKKRKINSSTILAKGSGTYLN
jgi:PAS domain S-box-containing protein